ncbi:MAG: hypothetical protein R3F53_05690 [Gammaproteobacteria bacterium]
MAIRIEAPNSPDYYGRFDVYAAYPALADFLAPDDIGQPVEQGG